jgi:hypothetical protein
MLIRFGIWDLGFGIWDLDCEAKKRIARERREKTRKKIFFISRFFACFAGKTPT